MKPANLTQLLSKWREGDRDARDDLFAVVYAELRKLASSYLSRERTGHTLQATALVHEAYIRLIDESTISWQNRAHFFGVAAEVMRHVLVDHARRRGATKRGGAEIRVTLTDRLGVAAPENEVDILSMDKALLKLAELDVQQSKIVEMRFFGGLTIEETAEATGISPATVKRDWALAKAWLKRELHSR